MSDSPAAEASGCGSSGGQGFAPAETVLIFDWDDTVLPSWWLLGQGLRLGDDSAASGWQAEQLLEVARLASETLRVAKRLGTVVLVTNAERGWIELSCRKFLPLLCSSLEGVELLSARSMYESPERPSPLDWKVCAFRSELLRIYGAEGAGSIQRRKNVVSLGDSAHEREALSRVAGELPNCRAKSLKFMARPGIGQICMEHSLVAGCLPCLVHHDGNLDLCVGSPQ